MSSYQYRKSHCGDKTVVRSSYLHNGISYTGKMSSLYWIRALVAITAITVTVHYRSCQVTGNLWKARSQNASLPHRWIYNANHKQWIIQTPKQYFSLLRTIRHIIDGWTQWSLGNLNLQPWTELSWFNWVNINIIVANGLAPYITRTSAAMILTMPGKLGKSWPYARKDFNYLRHVCVEEWH